MKKTEKDKKNFAFFLPFFNEHLSIENIFVKCHNCRKIHK